MNTSSIKRIALTGGPSSAKSKSLPRVVERLMEHKKICLTTPETATALHEIGFFAGHRSNIEEQKYVLLHQVRMEEHMLQTAASLANTMEGYEFVLLCDRSILDARGGHIDYDSYEKILKENGFPQGITDAFARYDAVFHMETAPKEYYSLDNRARAEKTREDGMIRNKLMLDAVVGHPHVRLISNNYQSVNEKIDDLANKILYYLGVPITYEIEDPYEVVDVDLKLFEEAGVTIRESNIEQDYLVSDDPNTVRRIRRRGWSDGARIFEYTEKYKNSDEEINKSLSPNEYSQLLRERDPKFVTIKKKRYNFVRNYEYFELDYFLTGKFAGRRVLEIEKMSKDQEIELPPFLNIKGPMTMRNIHMALQD